MEVIAIFLLLINPLPKNLWLWNYVIIWWMCKYIWSSRSHSNLGYSQRLFWCCGWIFQLQHAHSIQTKRVFTIQMVLLENGLTQDPSVFDCMLCLCRVPYNNQIGGEDFPNSFILRLRNGRNRLRICDWVRDYTAASCLHARLVAKKHVVIHC